MICHFNEFEARGKTEMKEKENVQETIQHLGELCYDNGITENDIWNFIRDKKIKGGFSMDEITIQKLVKKNGIRYQSGIAQEECAELIQAISKCLRSKEAIPIKERMNLIEEMADVQICLEQLQIMYYIDDEELYAMKQKKEKRLIERGGLKE